MVYNKYKELNDYVADAIYCNDRSFGSNNIGLGYGNDQKTTFYGAVSRYEKPTFKCPTKNDGFTIKDIEKGNGVLSEKVGLITKDEVSVAGGYTLANTNYYLYKGLGYWSFSPCSYNNFSAGIYAVTADGNIYNYKVSNNSISVAPVISLTPEYFNTLIGDGTMVNPFREKGMEP